MRADVGLPHVALLQLVHQPEGQQRRGQTVQEELQCTPEGRHRHVAFQRLALVYRLHDSVDRCGVHVVDVCDVVVGRLPLHGLAQEYERGRQARIPAPGGLVREVHAEAVADAAERDAEHHRRLVAGEPRVLPLNNLREAPVELGLRAQVAGIHQLAQRLHVVDVLELAPDARAHPRPEGPHAHPEAARGVKHVEVRQILSVLLREDVVGQSHPLRQPGVGPVHAKVAVDKYVLPMHSIAVHLQDDEPEGAV
mmetsp:Transcript_75483/g.233032  ORF Transcript_75483/g.233032 Transcript_75483/m.233032 type:complete len:252 (+) Transcript_75483:410-1165(+)